MCAVDNRCGAETLGTEQPYKRLEETLIMQTVLSPVVSWQVDSPSRYPPLHRLFPGITGSGAERQLPDLGTEYTQKQKTLTK